MFIDTRLFSLRGAEYLGTTNCHARDSSGLGEIQLPPTPPNTHTHINRADAAKIIQTVRHNIQSIKYAVKVGEELLLG